MSDFISQYNDIAFGVPCNFPVSVSEFEGALLRLIREGELPNGEESNYLVCQYSIAELDARLVHDVGLPCGVRGCFELFSEDDEPKYLVWRVNHVDVDVMGLLKLLERLRSILTGFPPRWTTLRESLNLPLSNAKHVSWVDTEHEPVNIDVEIDSIRSVSARIAASFIVALARKNGKSNFDVGFLSAGRRSDDPVEVGNHLKITVVNCLVDVAEAMTDPKATLVKVSESLLKSLNVGAKREIELAESVDVLINTQTVNWYALVCEIMGDSRSSLAQPILYRQVVGDTSQVRVDLELWDIDNPRMRFRSGSQQGRSQLLSDALSVINGKAEAKPLCVGDLSEFARFSKFVQDFVARQDETVQAEIARRCQQFIALDEKYAIGLVSGRGFGTFIDALCVMLTNRMCHFLGDVSKSSQDLEDAAAKLQVPVAIASGDGFQFVEVRRSIRSVAADSKHGWAYILSSGSTGKPKLTLLSFAISRNILGNAAKYLGISDSSLVAMISSAQFDAIYFECLIALLSFSIPMSREIHAVLDGSAVSFDVLGETHLVATPTVLGLLLGKGLMVPRTIMSVGEKLSEELASKLSALGCQVFDLYGPSEAGIWSGIRNVSLGELVFQPIDNVYFRPEGDSGEGRSKLYIGLSAAIYGHLALDVYSGDSAVFAEDESSIRDIRRADGILKIGGQRFTYAEISTRLSEDYEFEPTMIVELDYQKRKQMFVAVKQVDSKDQEEFRTVVAFGADFTLVAITDPPSTGTGKLDVKSLLDRFNWELKNGDSNSVECDVWSMIQFIWQRYTNSTSPDASFVDVGGTSLDAIRIQIDLNREGVRVPLPTATTTMRSLVEQATDLR